MTSIERGNIGTGTPSLVTVSSDADVPQHWRLTHTALCLAEPLAKARSISVRAAANELTSLVNDAEWIETTLIIDGAVVAAKQVFLGQDGWIITTINSPPVSLAGWRHDPTPVRTLQRDELVELFASDDNRPGLT